MRKTQHDPLAQALSSWKTRSVSEQTLSDEARNRILNETRSPARQACLDPVAPLFTPVRRLLLAAALPLALTAVLLATSPGWQAPANVAHPVNIRAQKTGDQVVFTIANGTRNHQVCRSTRPDDIDCSAGVRVTDGAYRDSIAGDTGAVFYLID